MVDAYPHYEDDENEKLDVFFELFAGALNARPDLSDLAVWANQRLDMHPNCRVEDAVVAYTLSV